jgi:hypothetical protein
MSAYSEAYEKFLLDALLKWSNDHKDDATKAFAEVFGKIEELIASGSSYYGWQGPTAYQIRWKGEAMVKAEVFAGAAAYLLREMADIDEQRHKDGSPVLPSQVLDELKKSLRQQIKAAVTEGNSGFHFEVARSVGKAAIEILEDNWDFSIIEFLVRQQAEREVTPDDIKEPLAKWRRKSDELRKKKSGMRSETRIAKINEEIEEVNSQIAMYEAQRDRMIALAKEEVTTKEEI